MTAGFDPHRGVHILAQTPDHVRLPIGRSSHARLLAEAYGVEQRISPRGPRIFEGSFAQSVEALWSGSDQPVPTMRGDDSVLAGHRVVLITNIPAHYRAPLYEMVGRRLEAAGASFEVVFLAKTHPGRGFMSDTAHRYRHSFLRALEIPFGESHRFVPVDLEARLFKARPTQIVTGGFSPLASTRVAAVAMALRVPLGIFSGEIPATAVNRPRLSLATRRHLARRVSFGLAYGSSAAAYLRSLSQDLPTVVTRNTALAPNRRRNRTDGEIRVLSVGRLTDGKRTEVIVDALRHIPEARLRLTVVGDGARLPYLHRLAAGDERIKFLGALTSDETRDVYRDHDLFVFPSRYDIWGLALVEAMSAGLACVSSTKPGAAHDLCVDTNSCLIVDDERSAWDAALRELAADEALRTRLGAAAARTVERRWTMAHSADAFVAGLRLGALVAKARGLSQYRRGGTRGSP